jgi:hypothetical protein
MASLYPTDFNFSQYHRLQSRQMIGRFLVIAFCRAEYSTIKCLAQMERDLLLSRIARSTQRELNKEVLFKIFAYGALPVLGIFASPFPTISNSCSLGLSRLWKRFVKMELSRGRITPPRIALGLDRIGWLRASFPESAYSSPRSCPLQCGLLLPETACPGLQTWASLRRT